MSELECLVIVLLTVYLLIPEHIEEIDELAYVPPPDAYDE